MFGHCFSSILSLFHCLTPSLNVFGGVVCNELSFLFDFSAFSGWRQEGDSRGRPKCKPLAGCGAGKDEMGDHHHWKEGKKSDTKNCPRKTASCFFFFYEAVETKWMDRFIVKSGVNIRQRLANAQYSNIQGHLINISFPSVNYLMITILGFFFNTQSDSYPAISPPCIYVHFQ